jgi:hypothetical protein
MSKKSMVGSKTCAPDQHRTKKIPSEKMKIWWQEEPTGIMQTRKKSNPTETEMSMNSCETQNRIEAEVTSDPVTPKQNGEKYIAWAKSKEQVFH